MGQGLLGLGLGLGRHAFIASESKGAGCTSMEERRKGI
jgi:hypothetical protein